MNDSRRRVTMFMIGGVLAAIIAGLVVWKVSLPSSPQEPGYRADGGASREHASASTHTSHGSSSASSSSSRPTESRADSGQTEWPADPAGTPRVNAEAAERDPLLPPNAVVNAAPRAATPTQVYRPSNVVPTSVIKDDTASGTDVATTQGSPEPSATGTTGGTPTVTDPTAPSGTQTSPTGTEPSPGGTPLGTPSPTDVESLLAPNGIPTAPGAPTGAPQGTSPALAEDPAAKPVQQNLPADNAPWWARLFSSIR